MKIKNVSQLLFAVVLIGLGILGLVKGDFAPGWQPVPASMPGRQLLAYLCALICIACGLGVLWRRTAALAARVLFAWLLAWLLLLRLPWLLVSFTVDIWWSASSTAIVTATTWVLYISLASDWDKQGDGRTYRPGSSAVITPFITFQASSMAVWISVDRSNNRVSLGQGYMMKCNEVAWLQLEDRSKGARLPGTASAHTPVWEVQQVVFDSKVAFYDDREPRVNLMPVVVNVAPVVVGRDAITLENIAHSDCVPASELPDASQVLWGTVSGERIRVSDSDAAAINYSLDTPGKTLYEIVERKRRQSEFGDPHMVYVRVTIGPPLGDSPGSPFVMEIWPVGCYSPVHNHGGTVAVIKVLHGSILSRWYNPLADKDNPEPVSFAEQTFDAGGVTWLTPEMYQTHQLRNPRSDTACVTIQSYRYLTDDDVHYEYFDYVGPKGGELKHFTPDSDITYTELIERVRKEYAEARVTERSVPGTRLHAPR